MYQGLREMYEGLSCFFGMQGVCGSVKGLSLRSGVSNIKGVFGALFEMYGVFRALLAM